MKVFVSCIVRIDSTEIIGVYSSFDVALGKADRKMEELYDNNEDYGCYPEIQEFEIDDMSSEDYT